MKNVNHLLPLFKSALFNHFIINILLQPITTLGINTSTNSNKTIFDNVFLSTVSKINPNNLECRVYLFFREKLIIL